MKKLITCAYFSDCVHSGMIGKCGVCSNNTTRHKKIDFFEAANDNPIPDKCPKLTYRGPAEHTAGYECPVCGSFTNPYHLREDHLCSGCGYELNI